MGELNPAERWVWVGLLLMAGDSNQEGIIYLRKNESGIPIGYSDGTLAELLGLENVEDFRKALKKMQKYSKISINKSKVIKILNWKKYQSEYKRQSLYRGKLQENNNFDSNESNSLELDIDKEEDKDMVTAKYYDAHLALASLMEKGIKQRLPKHKLAGDYLDRWANVFRLMEEVDKENLDDIKAVIQAVYNDDFWYKNILSAEKFRKQYGRLFEDLKDKKQSNPHVDQIGKSKDTDKKPDGYYNKFIKKDQESRKAEL